MRVHQEERKLGSIKVWLCGYRLEGRCLTCGTALIQGYDVTCGAPPLRQSFPIVWVSSECRCNR
jgi:hypothetical protein